MKYGAHIDGYAPLKDSAGFRFNTYIWQAELETITTDAGYEYKENLILDLYVKGLRVKGSLIHMPAMGARLAAYPTTFLPRVFAEALVKEVLGNENLRREFPNSFPLINADLLVENLLFNQRDMPRDYPELARMRGLMGE